LSSILRKMLLKFFFGIKTLFGIKTHSSKRKLQPEGPTPGRKVWSAR
jgi:hypothetical protein